MATDWARLRDDLFWERGGNKLTCEIEGCKKFPTELHHCFFHGMKGFEKSLDTKFNLQWVCNEHHQSIANSDANERYFWKIQCARYGIIAMRAWWESVPFESEKKRFWD